MIVLGSVPVDHLPGSYTRPRARQGCNRLSKSSGHFRLPPVPPCRAGPALLAGALDQSSFGNITSSRPGARRTLSSFCTKHRAYETGLGHPGYRTAEPADIGGGWFLSGRHPKAGMMPVRSRSVPQCATAAKRLPHRQSRPGRVWNIPFRGDMQKTPSSASVAVARMQALVLHPVISRVSTPCPIR